ncbi:hypothetical protein B0H13DRAFT_1860987 [Mycena leptocephala]|nr:hypothetical protein B0H13DRAFT_1860987 [Mycena leptocephala]
MPPNNATVKVDQTSGVSITPSWPCSSSCSVAVGACVKVHNWSVGWAAHVAALDPVTAKPTPEILLSFTEVYSETLSSFTSGALTFSLANTARERLATEMEGAVILGDAGTAGLEADMIAMRDMLVVSQKAAATFLLACYNRAVKLLAEITSVDTVSAGFKTKLSDIVKPLLAGSQFPATMYDVYIAAVATALKDELCSIKLDVLAKAMRQKKEQADKLAAATSANADADMADGTKTVGELVKEQFKVEMQKIPSSTEPQTGWWRKRKRKPRDESGESGSGPVMKIQHLNPVSPPRENSNAVLTWLIFRPLNLLTEEYNKTVDL